MKVPDIPSVEVNFNAGGGSSILAELFEAAGRRARAERLRNWDGLVGSHTMVVAPVLLAVVPVLWWLGEHPVTLVIVAVQLVLAMWLALLGVLRMADQRRTRGAEHLARTGLVAVGGLAALPASWLVDQRYAGGRRRLLDRLDGPSGPVLLNQLGLQGWLKEAGLSSQERDVFDALVTEYEGTLGDLVETVRRLA